ncbi:unnamed protein product [Caenorhabditis auriculariae]|uniref:UPAR/Ly6 domain-containing protein n=1 Tax=Caenorhabditis auriculariae TaxID=2777116 RepID=A0A8S1H8B6_9PELO|nr:unnamed protein product [Caenorhabditis auriculariae]
MGSNATTRLVVVLVWTLATASATYKEYSSRSRQSQSSSVTYLVENVLKLKCYQCNQPYDCSTGTCYGDICVKSLVDQHYVSKGCENLTVSGNVYEPQLKLKAYCKDEEVLGVDTVTCYCRDNDFCNDVGLVTSSAALIVASLTLLLRIHVL